MLLSWGANSHGQLGLNTKNEQIETPSEVNTDRLSSPIQSIACGGGHTLLIDTEGKLFSCGWNHKLQLGYDEESSVIQRVWPLSGIEFTHIACGWDFSCAVTKDQFLFVWGSNSHGQLGLPKDHFPEVVKPVRLHVIVKAVSMGLRHTAIINSKAEVWVTGCGKYGQLGLGPEKLSSDRFEKVTKIGKISNIACGQNHTLGWSSDEKALYVWGDNRHGQLLLDTEKYKKIFNPQKIDIDVRQEVNKLLSGWTNALLWLENGKLLTWGRNNYGQLGNKTVEQFSKIGQIILPGGRQVADIALGSEHTVGLASDNTLWAWGWNEHANTGTKNCDAVFEPTLVPLNNQFKVNNIYAGGSHNFIVVEQHENVIISDNKYQDQLVRLR